MSSYSAEAQRARALEDRPNLGIEAAKILPFYFVVDVSFSMQEEIGIVSNELINLRNAMIANPVLDDICQLGIITFASDATVNVPLGNLSQIPDSSLDLVCRGMTNFEEALRLLADDSVRRINQLKQSNSKYKIYRPTAFFVTDGFETHGDTEAGLRWLNSVNPRPNVIPFGFRDADPDSIRRLAVPGTGPSFIQKEGANAVDTINSIIKIVTRTIVTQTQTASQGEDVGGLVLRPEDQDVLVVQTSTDFI